MLLVLITREKRSSQWQSRGTSQRLPERGLIGIFNRSYYEEVLVVRVHPDLLKQEKIPLGEWLGCRRLGRHATLERRR